MTPHDLTPAAQVEHDRALDEGTSPPCGALVHAVPMPGDWFLGDGWGRSRRASGWVGIVTQPCGARIGAVGHRGERVRTEFDWWGVPGGKERLHPLYRRWSRRDLP